MVLLIVSDLARMSEDGPSLGPAVASAVSESQPPPQNLSPNHPSRTDEIERPAERHPPLELPPEPCKVPLRIPMSSSILESHPMTHISTNLPGGTLFPIKNKLLSARTLQLTISAYVCFMQKFLLRHPLFIYHSKNPSKSLWQ